MLALIKSADIRTYPKLSQTILPDHPLYPPNIMIGKRGKRQVYVPPVVNKPVKVKNSSADIPVSRKKTASSQSRNDIPVSKKKPAAKDIPVSRKRTQSSPKDIPISRKNNDGRTKK